MVKKIRKTQVESLKKTQVNIGLKQKTVYSVIKSKGKATNKMIARQLGWDINRVTGRVTELVNKGMVTADGTYKDKETNRTVTLWTTL
jgi:DNA-binding MarR family transcriptional regulator|tara:strand:+ start:214 stop:477 length:264 start_codon:yes stop_codon:yes gene_type:complete